MQYDNTNVFFLTEEQLDYTEKAQKEATKKSVSNLSEEFVDQLKERFHNRYADTNKFCISTEAISYDDAKDGRNLLWVNNENYK